MPPAYGKYKKNGWKFVFDSPVPKGASKGQYLLFLRLIFD